MILEIKDFLEIPKECTQFLYLVQHGSHAYGVSTKDSDYDIYGVVLEKPEVANPFNSGYIWNFDKEHPDFKQFQEHKLLVNKYELDVSYYGLATYMRLLVGCNPNITETLFSKVSYVSDLFKPVLEKRDLFLSKETYLKFKGFSKEQETSLKSGKSKENPKRAELISNFGYDTKFAYHMIRLALECKEILESHTLDLTKHKDLLLGIRDGNHTLDWVLDEYTKLKESNERLFETSTLQEKVDKDEARILIKQIHQIAYK